MARALGWNAALLLVYESTYGTSPGGNFQTLPFVDCDLGAEQSLIDDDVLGLGRDPQAPSRDLVRVGGQITVPLDVRSLGYWLKLVYGAPTTTGTSYTHYTHTFVSGLTTGLPSASIEVGIPDIPTYFLYEGVKADSIRFELSRTGNAQAVIQLAGQKETKNATSQGGTPAAAPMLTRFNQVHGKIQRNAVDLANIVSSNMEYRNNLEAVDTIRADSLVEGQDEGIAGLSGGITSRFASTTLYDDAVAETVLDIDLVYTIDADNKLTIAAQSAHLPRTKNPIRGPGGIEATFDFQGSDDAVEGEMMEVVLINNVANYNNPA